MRGRTRALVVAVVLLGVGAGAGELLPTERDASPERLKMLAENYERDGQPLEAAAAYERLVELEPANKTVLANRLVRIYAESGMEDEALRWAGVVVERNPEPQAYLAGVHMKLGNSEKAIALLEEALARTEVPRQRLTLYWQLAEAHEQAGDGSAAEQAYLAGVEEVKGTRDEAAAWRRLCRFYDARGTLADHVTAWEARLAEDPEDVSMQRVVAIVRQMGR